MKCLKNVFGLVRYCTFYNYHNITVLGILFCERKKKIRKMKYPIFQCYDNCKMYDTSQILTHFNALHLFLIRVHLCQKRARAGDRFRFPMWSLEFLIDLILPAALWPWSWPNVSQKLVPGISRAGLRLPVLEIDNLTTFICRLAGNLVASASWNPQGLYGPVQGLLYLYAWRGSNKSKNVALLRIVECNKLSSLTVNANHHCFIVRTTEWIPSK
jgi:hypothetical protein